MLSANIKHRSSQRRSITTQASLKRLSRDAVEDIRKSEHYSSVGVVMVVVLGRC